jgi:dihydropteroate synthase-like protein
MTEEILKSKIPLTYDLVLLPGFIQWNSSILEKKFSIEIKKGPEFASDLSLIIKNLEKIQLSNKIPANKIIETSGEAYYKKLVEENFEKAKNNLGYEIFYINEDRSDIIIGGNLPPPIIAEIVNCTEKSEKNILKKAEYYINSGADIIDIGCVSNKPNPDKVREVIKILRKNREILLSIDSMDPSEILAAVDEGIDMILSFDASNYQDCLNIPKNIPIVILPTNIKQGYFPTDPKTRVNNLLSLTKELRNNGFKKLIADPLLETPIAPGIMNSLEAYFLYHNIIPFNGGAGLKLPLFFGISNVVELMDVDSVGINGLLASIAVELDVGILFTVEHSTKLMGGVAELKESVKLNYISKQKRTPPINQGIQVFKAKGKTSQESPKIDINQAVQVTEMNPDYDQDEKGYFKIHTNHYYRQIYVLFYSNEHQLVQTIVGSNAEALSKKIIELGLTDNLSHINYIGRELKKAEINLYLGKPYIQDE